MAAPTTLENAAARLAALLTGDGGGLADPGAADLEFEPSVHLRPLPLGPAPADVSAVDGGQALVADARCIQLVETRAARVRFCDGTCVLEDEGELRAQVLGGNDNRVAALALLDGVSLDTSVDINLLRDWWEWDAVAHAVAEADAGGLVLVDGDLQPDWRIPSARLGRLLASAAAKDVTLAGVTKHSSLSRGGAPLLGQLEREAEVAFGPRARWWAPIARTRTELRPDLGAGLQVVAARLDPDAPFAFRIDLPAEADAEAILGSIAAVSDDAGFPGYPYPLTVADRLASCPAWLRQEVRMQLDSLFDEAGVPLDVRERAFADRHNLMERA